MRHVGSTNAQTSHGTVMGAAKHSSGPTVGVTVVACAVTSDIVGCVPDADAAPVNGQKNCASSLSH